MGKPFKLANGLLLLSTEAPGGIYNSAQLKKIASLCDGDSSVVKATEDQRLAIFVASEKAAKVAAELKAVGLGVRHYQDGLHQPVNCLGEMCSEHLQDALATSMELTRELAGTTLGTPLKIGINGCARSCVATHTLDISIIGDTNGYRISLGGKNSQLPEMASFMAEGVPAAKLPKLIAKVVSVYKELAQKGETLQEVTERAGSKRFIEALAPYSQDAHQDDPFSGLGEDSGAGTSAHSGPEIDADFGDVAANEPNIEDLQMMEDDPESTESDASGLDLNMGEGDSVAAPSDDFTVTEELAMTEELVMTDDVSADGTDEQSFEDGFTEELSLEDSPSDELTLENPSTEELAITEDAPLASDDLELIMEDAPGGLDASAVAFEEDTPVELEELNLEDVDFPAPVAAAPKAAIAAAPETETDELTADEVSDADADAFEEKLNASIAEEEAFPEIEDANSLDRLEAMKLVEEGGDEEPVDETVHESLAVDNTFQDLQIDHEEEVFEGEPAAHAMPAATHGTSIFEFVGFDLAGDRVSLNFSSGASVAIDPRMIAPNSRRDLTVGGKKISVGHVDGGLEVEVDGVAIFLPKRAA